MRTCGLVSTYKHGCRCEECKRAVAERARRYRAERGPVVLRKNAGPSKRHLFATHREWVIEQDRRENQDARVARFYEAKATRRVLPDGRIEEQYRDRSGRVVEVRRFEGRTEAPTISEWRERAAAASADDWMPPGDFVFHQGAA